MATYDSLVIVGGSVSQIPSADLLGIGGGVEAGGVAAPSVAPAGTGRIYFDSSSNTFKVSQNGGAYTNLYTGGTVTSVSGGGGGTGLTLTGGPITGSGTLTLGGTLLVGSGGTGAGSFTANAVLLGNGTNAFQVVAPGTNGNVLTSNGTTWVSQAPAAGGGSVTGTGVDNQIAVWSGTSSLDGSSSLTFDGTTLIGPSTVVFGNGDNVASPTSGLIRASDNSTQDGTNANLTIRPGYGTNATSTAPSGYISFKTKAGTAGAGVEAEVLRLDAQTRALFGGFVMRFPASGTNAAGSNFLIGSGPGTGTGASGSVIFYTTATGVSESAEQSFAERARITGTGSLVVGNGDTSSSPAASTIRGTDGSGTNIAGAALTIRGGLGTGTGTPGNLVFQTATAGSTGSTLQTASTRLTISSTTITSTLPVYGPAGSESATTFGTNASHGIFFPTLWGSQPSVAVSVLGTRRIAFDEYNIAHLGAPTMAGFGTTFNFRMGVSTGTDIQGGDVTFDTGRGTGSATGSSFVVSTPTPTTTGTSQQSLATRLTINSTGLTSTVPLILNGMAAPSVSAAGTGRIYFDSTANLFKVSENGGAYTNLVGGGSGGSTVDITVTTTGLTAGDVCYVSANNTASAANATAIATANALGIVQTVAGAGSGKVRTQGVITANFITGLTLSAGQTAYLSKTVGKLTNDVSAYTTGNVYVPVGIITNVTTAGGGTGAADVAVNLDLIIVV